MVARCGGRARDGLFATRITTGQRTTRRDAILAFGSPVPDPQNSELDGAGPNQAERTARIAKPRTRERQRVWLILSFSHAPLRPHFRKDCDRPRAQGHAMLAGRPSYALGTVHSLAAKMDSTPSPIEHGLDPLAHSACRLGQGRWRTGRPPAVRMTVTNA